MNIPVILAMLVAIIITAFFLVWLVLEFKKNINVSKHYKKTKGEIIDYISRRNYPDMDTIYHPIVKYEVGGREYEVTSNVSYASKLSKTKKFTILYNPDNPYEAVMTNHRNLLLVMIIMFTVGILLCLYILVNVGILKNDGMSFHKNKFFTYKVTCQGRDYTYRAVDAKSSKESLKKLSEDYRNRGELCDFEEINSCTDKVYTYKGTCKHTIVYDVLEIKEAESSKQALELILEEYQNKGVSCDFQEVNTCTK